jgi:ribosomal protein S5
MCNVIGIEDLSAKVEGSTKNYQNICKAFFKGLEKQVT